MEVEVLGINGPVAFKPIQHSDKRGSFKEIYNQDRYNEWIPSNNWVQVNHSISNKGTIRGLHYRTGEAKLVTVVQGIIWDVMVDIRPESPTMGNWVSVMLKPGEQMYVPDGFAHGFETTSKVDSHVVYLTNKMYDPEQAKGLAWNDSYFNIKWHTKKPKLSDQDKANQSFEYYVKNLDNG